VCVVEEHEVFRRGLVASLGDHAAFVVSEDHDDDLSTGTEPADVAVTSDISASGRRFHCPLVVCTAEPAVRRLPHPGNVVAGVLLRATMTEVQLYATVNAVAAGLRVNADTYALAVEYEIDGRAARVAELLANGCTTSEIATDVGYSERTVKKVITELERALSARSRAQIVAHAIRGGLI
jgi:DNA-binding CsgD family transcriptional regulator